MATKSLQERLTEMRATKSLQRPEPVAELWSIDPSMASMMLERNTHNRKLRERKAKSYAQQMKAGKWWLNGDTVVFDRNGVLMNGQHRLEAIVLSGCKIETFVVFGLQPQVFTTIDINAVRTASDVVGIDHPGMPYIKARAAAICARSVGYMKSSYPAYQQPGGARAEITNEDTVQMVRNDPSIIDSVEWVMSFPYRQLPLTRGMTAAAYYMFRELDEAEARDFLSKVITGVGLDDGSAELEYRKAWASKSASRKDWTPAERSLMLFKAWNIRRRGRNATQAAIRVQKRDPRYIKPV